MLLNKINAICVFTLYIQYDILVLTDKEGDKKNDEDYRKHVLYS